MVAFKINVQKKASTEYFTKACTYDGEKNDVGTRHANLSACSRSKIQKMSRFKEGSCAAQGRPFHPVTTLYYCSAFDAIKANLPP